MLLLGLFVQNKKYFVSIMPVDAVDYLRKRLITLARTLCLFQLFPARAFDSHVFVSRSESILKVDPSSLAFSMTMTASAFLSSANNARTYNLYSVQLLGEDTLQNIQKSDCMVNGCMSVVSQYTSRSFRDVMTR